MATVALSSKEGKWVMVSTIMASAMAFIDGSALNVVLPSLQQNLHATGADLFWILNAYLLMLASLILIGGSLGDKLGRKKVFMAGIFYIHCRVGVVWVCTKCFAANYFQDSTGHRWRVDDTG